MTATETIELVLKVRLLRKSLVFVPDRGATEPELVELSKKLSRPLSSMHISLLRRWNGLNLDVIRLYGASPTASELRGIAEAQSGPIVMIPGMVVFGDDPSGYVYAEALSGEVVSFDSSSGESKIVASSLDDFFGRLVFGSDAGEFAGDRWLQDIRSVGLA